MVELRVSVMGRIVDHLTSYDTNVMLAAIISLLIVILFVLLLHLFAKWFLSPSSHRRLPPPSLFLHSRRFAHTRLHHSFSSAASKGLESGIIASIPLFVYRAVEVPSHEAEECVICLSAFEENEVCRRLSRCRHGFHVDCIDMWLRSHSDCPVCRSPATGDRIEGGKGDGEGERSGPGDGVYESVMIVFERPNAEVRVPGDSSAEIVWTASSACSSSNSLGCSLKSMLSRNRSDAKAIPSPSTPAE